MKMALTVWENRISPMFDAAHMLLVVEIENTKITNRCYVPFYPEFPSRLAAMLAEMDVEVFICGAISEMPANILEANGIKLIPFITGDAGKVIDAYVKDIPFMPAFLMPGCSHNRRRRKGKGKKHGARFAHGREVTEQGRKARVCEPEKDKDEDRAEAKTSDKAIIEEVIKKNISNIHGRKIIF
jgi:predicted Fe-Mo cluster-binding NifX family protein